MRFVLELQCYWGSGRGSLSGSRGTWNLSRKISSASSLGSLEESHFLQASLDSSDSISDRRNPGELSMSPYYVKSMTLSSFEAALR
ncbi:hypothetical protein LR48_Vigan03g081600 [Vigna angularis]|uniref:Uncharacterized protein n=1 Tax=Phaseolus angularis TaxID=3914 RepID=A0A0L9U4W3_PHAAN|nr:hypothetical protein LR48_Vigan03g081600 [Vigna angularis]